MKELFCCLKCGFLSTIRSAFNVINGNNYCDACIPKTNKDGKRIHTKDNKNGSPSS